MSEDQKANVITVPLNDDGTIGALPDPLQKFLDAKIAQVSKRFERKADVPDPVERERLRQLEAENQQYRVGEAEREKRYEDALKMREDEWAKRLEATKADLAKRDARLVAATGAEIRAAALRYGARDESLEDIEALLRARVTLNADLAPVVLDDKGEPTDLTIDALVKATLDKKPYFRTAPAAGGGAPGGAFTQTGTAVGVAAELLAAEAAYGKAPTAENMQRFLSIQRRMRQAG